MATRYLLTHILDLANSSYLCNTAKLTLCRTGRVLVGVSSVACLTSSGEGSPAGCDRLMAALFLARILPILAQRKLTSRLDILAILPTTAQSDKSRYSDSIYKTTLPLSWVGGVDACTYVRARAHLLHCTGANEGGAETVEEVKGGVKATCT